MTATFSLNEASFLTEQPAAAISRAIDHQEKSTDGSLQEGARRISLTELRTVAGIGEIGEDLTPTARQKVFAAVRRLGPHVPGLDLDDLDRRIAERLFRLEALRQLVEPCANGDPLIRGTRSSVYAVAAFTRGQTVAEIMEDCPGLTPELIEAAVKYAEVYPRAGDQLPTRSFKRMLSDMATSGVWDVETDDEPLIL